MNLGDTIAPPAGARQRRSRGGFIAIVVLSLGLHVGAVFGLMWLERRAPRTQDFQRAIPVELVKLGKARDPKLLPRKVAAPPPPKAEGIALEKKPPPKAPPKPKVKKAPEPELSAAAKRMLEESTLDRALDRFTEAEGAEDGSVDGTTTDATNAARGYAAQISQTLKSKYRLPQSIAPSERRFLRARVVLWIERNGAISRFEFVEVHPNRAFMRALRTLLEGVRLPVPPKSLAKQYRTDGVEIIFRL